MKAKHLILLIVSILVIDQASKFYIKLNFYAGEDYPVLGNWFKLHFVENEGMAWGWKFGGEFGKIALTLFRLVAVIWGSFLLKDFIQKKYHKGFIICGGLIYAGAFGNLIDSMFYGLIFDNSIPYTTTLATFLPEKGGYAGFLHGKVVDMLYFPLIDTTYPTWVPFVGGERFSFFDPVFNIADASISIGVTILLIFQNKFFKKEEETQPATNTTNES
ncbi:MAG: lipoprotein signal peptidase [Chitinophagaceae bacterium]